MARAESRSRIIEDATTADNLKIHSDGSVDVNSQDIVDAINSIGVSVALARFRPSYYNDAEEVEVEDTDTTLATITANGKLDGILCTFDKKDVEFILVIDGIEKLRVTLEDLDNTLKYNMGQGNVEFFPIKVASSGKTVLIQYSTPPDFTTSLVIKGKSIGQQDAVLKGIFIAYREKIT